MLSDSKAQALMTNFAGQWLYLRELANVQTSAKNFDDNLRQAFRRETEMLFESVVREDRSVVTCSMRITRSWTSGSRSTTAFRIFTAAISGASLSTPTARAAACSARAAS